MQHRMPQWRCPSQVTASNSRMCRPVRLLFALALICTTGAACAEEVPTTAAVMDALTESDWRRPDPANLLYMRLPHGEIILELAPGFAPENVTNIKLLVTEKYFDNLAIIRSQDNYVVQWGDPASEEEAAMKRASMCSTVRFSVTLSPTIPQVTPSGLRKSFCGSVMTNAVSSEFAFIFVSPLL